jgi:hypothetical protein
MTPARIEPAGNRDLDSGTALLDAGAEVPAAVQESVESIGACPRTAHGMVREVEP